MQASTSKEEKELEFECMTDEFTEHFAKGSKVFVLGTRVYDAEKNLIDVDYNYIVSTPDEFKPIEKTGVKKKLPRTADACYVLSDSFDLCHEGSEKECVAFISTAEEGSYMLVKKLKSYKVKHEIKITEVDL